MFCPKCGAQQNDDAKFCGNCGAPLQRVPNAVANNPSAAAPQPKAPTKRKVPAIPVAIAAVAAVIVIGIVVYINVFANTSFKGTVSIWMAPAQSDEETDLMSITVADNKIRVNSENGTFTGSVESVETLDDSIIYTTSGCTDANGEQLDPNSLGTLYVDIKNPRYRFFIPKDIANGKPNGYIGLYLTAENTNDAIEADIFTGFTLIKIDGDDTATLQSTIGSFDSDTTQQLDPASDTYIGDVSKLEDKISKAGTSLTSFKGMLSDEGDNEWRFSIPDGQNDFGISYEADED